MNYRYVERYYDAIRQVDSLMMRLSTYKHSVSTRRDDPYLTLKYEKSMSQLLIEIDSPEDEAILLSLLPKLNARVLAQAQPGEPKLSFIEIAEQIAAKGGITSINDPSEWQREIRSWDRVLDGREE